MSLNINHSTDTISPTSGTLGVVGGITSNGTSVALAIGASTILKYTVSWTPANVGALLSAEQTVAVTGLQTGDVVFISPPGATVGVVVGAARVSAVNTLAVQFGNVTAGILAPPAGTYIVGVIRP